MRDEGLEQQWEEDASEAAADKGRATGETAARVEPVGYAAVGWVDKERGSRRS